MTKTSDDDYTALNAAATVSARMAALFTLVGGVSLFLGFFGGVTSMIWEVWSLPITVAFFGGLFALGLGLMFSGWRLGITADIMRLQINQAQDVRRIHLLLSDLRSSVGLQSTHLKAISASSARTAEAVEALATSVKR